MSLRSYILEDEFKMIVLHNKIDIINYMEMGHFDESKVFIKYKANERIKTLVIKGKNLVISRIKKSEVLIEGMIKIIELG